MNPTMRMGILGAVAFAFVLALYFATEPLGQLDAQRRLGGFLRREGLTLPDPWAKSHLLLALGRDAGDPPGAILKDLGAAIEQDAEGQPIFMRGSPSLRGDAHLNSTVFDLLTIGVPEGYTFRAPHGLVTLGQIRNRAQQKIDMKSQEYLQESGWSLGLYLRYNTSPEDERRSVVLAEVQRLLAAQKAIADSESTGALVKRREGVFAQACGGFHWIEGAFTKPRETAIHKDLQPLAERQIELLALRLKHEPKLYEQAASQPPEGVSAADWAETLRCQKLRFYGHFLETVAYLADNGYARKTLAVEALVAEGRRGLEATVGEIEAHGGWGNLRQTFERRPQVAYDLFGDGCHAYRALLWLDRLGF